MWTLAINAQGQAYGVAYEGGNLHEINLNDASTTVVGPTGKEVWYTQSMAFDFETGELFWAQFATTEDHGCGTNRWKCCNLAKSSDKCPLFGCCK